MRKLIKQGEIGSPKVAVHYASSSLMHGHIHSVDTLMYLLGDPAPKSVWGELRPRNLSIENNRLSADPSSVYHIEFDSGLEAWTIPSGNWDFEVFGTEGSIKSMNNGIDFKIFKVDSLNSKRRVFREVPYPACKPESATVNCLLDIIRAFETKSPTLGNVEVTHQATEACLAVAESHRQGGKRANLPLENRELYVWHV